MPDSIRVRVCAVVIRDKKVLLFPHIHEDKLIWFLPGGGVDFGETLRHAAERECDEETGIQITCDEMLTVIETIEPHVPYNGISHVFMGIDKGGDIITEHHPKYGDKTAQWFSWDDFLTISLPASRQNSFKSSSVASISTGAGGVFLTAFGLILYSPR